MLYPLLMPETTRSGRPLGLQNLRDRDVDAVGRRAVHFVDAILELLHAQRPAQRQRVADRAGFEMRRDNGDVPKRASARASSCTPSDRTPSSLVTRIRFIDAARREWLPFQTLRKHEV